jgi:hypothetical protein
MWVAEPAFLLYDEIREPATHLAILKAIGASNHSLSQISNAALVCKGHLSAYLARLQELRLVERRMPVTVPPAKRHGAQTGRYHLSDPCFRFAFAFSRHARMNWPTTRSSSFPAPARDCVPSWARRPSRT